MHRRPHKSFVISNPRDLIRAFETLIPLQKLLIFPELVQSLANADWDQLKMNIRDLDPDASPVARNRNVEMVSKIQAFVTDLTRPKIIESEIPERN